MKYIITESQYKLLRRESDIEKRVNNQLLMSTLQHDIYFIPLDHLILHVADNVAVEMSNESNLEGDNFVIFRNQIKQFIRNNFYTHIKQYWEKYRGK